VKAALALAFVVAVTFVTSPSILLAAVLLLILGAAVSGVPMAKYLARVFLVAPLFTAVVMVPALFSGITPGHALVHLGPWALTREGLYFGAAFTLRMSAALCALQLLVMTTPWHALIKALAVPGPLGTVTLLMLLTYRYIHVLITSAIEGTYGIAARTVGTLRPGQARTLLAGHILSLFVTSRAMAAEVHDAMKSRGYRAL